MTGAIIPKPCNMLKIIEYFRHLIEIQAFGVCQQLGKYLGIPSRRVRLFFMYATFLATWSPVIIYMSLAFVFNIGKYIKQQKAKSRIWDL